MLQSTFSITLTTLALYQSRSWWFAICSCKPIAGGLLPSLTPLAAAHCHTLLFDTDIENLYEARLVKPLVWSDWFIPLFGFSQWILFVSNLRPIKLYDDTHSVGRAFPLSIQFELSPGQIRTNFKLE